MTRYDTIWDNMTQYDTTWHNMLRCDTIWHTMTQYATIWHNMTQYDTIWHDMTLYDTIWHTMTQYDTIWHNMTRYNSIIIYCSLLIKITVFSLTNTDKKYNLSGDSTNIDVITLLRIKLTTLQFTSQEILVFFLQISKSSSTYPSSHLIRKWNQSNFFVK